MSTFTVTAPTSFGYVITVSADIVIDMGNVDFFGNATTETVSGAFTVGTKKEVAAYRKALKTAGAKENGKGADRAAPKVAPAAPMFAISDWTV